MAEGAAARAGIGAELVRAIGSPDRNVRPTMIVAILFVFVCAQAGAHIIETYRLMDTQRTITVGARAVELAYACRIRDAALQNPTVLLDPNKDGKVDENELQGVLNQARDNVIADLFVVDGKAQLKPELSQFTQSADKRGFEMKVTVPLPPTPAGEEMLTIIDPVYLIPPPAGSDPLKPTVVKSAEGVRVKQTGGKLTDAFETPTIPNMFVTIARAGAVAGGTATVVNSSAGGGTSDTVASLASSSSNESRVDPPVPRADAVKSQQRLRNLLGPERLSVWIIVGSLFVAVLLGAAHALTPGHGKTIVGAYLVGSHGRIRDAVYLGFIVTFTHTSTVILLGIGALVASKYVVQQQLFHYLGFLSGLLVFLFGAGLFLARWRKTGEPAHAHAHPHEHSHSEAVGGEPHVHHEHPHTHAALAGGDLVHAHAHTHLGHGHEGNVEHVHSHGADATHVHTHGEQPHTHAGELVHSHGGHVHSHKIPERMSLKGLAMLGIAGGIVPCPDAIVVLLIAIAMHRIGFGLAIIGAFSVGLAAVLIAIGILMVTARPALERISGGSGSRFAQVWLPIGSAAIVTLLGLGIMVQVLIDAGVLTVRL